MKRQTIEEYVREMLSRSRKKNVGFANQKEVV